MKTKLIYSLLLIVGLVACDDFLEQEPGTQISITEQLSTYKGVREALSGNYQMLSSLMMNQVNAVYADACGGNISFSPSLLASSKGIIKAPRLIENAYSFSDDKEDSNMSAIYDECYKIINGCNMLIENVDALEDASEAQKQQVKAECYSMRGLCHFTLLRYYAQNYLFTEDASHKGIIYNLKTQTVGVDYPARETVQQCYEYVLDDFNTAIKLFTETNTLDGEDHTLLTAINTTALMARAALYANEWQMAYDLATEVITSSGIDIMMKDDYVAQWEEPNASISEVLFELSIPYNSEGELATSNSVSDDFGYNSPTDYKEYVASGDLLNLFESTDIRGLNMFIEAELETVVGEDKEDRPYYFTKKFQDNPGYPVIRMSEIYLIRAEAAARLNLIEEAFSDLRTIQSRAGATLSNESDDILEALFAERRKELCFEGHLLFDIARYQKNVVREEGCAAKLCNLTYPSNYFVLPIPERNVELNSNLIQNEGY
jgi:hypothetical protein